MVLIGYLLPTVIAIFIVGAFAPLVGLVVGFFFHMFIMIFEIHKILVQKDKRDKVQIVVEEYKRERDLNQKQMEKLLEWKWIRYLNLWFINSLILVFYTNPNTLVFKRAQFIYEFELYLYV